MFKLSASHSLSWKHSLVLGTNMALNKQGQLHFVERILILLDAGLPLLESIALIRQSAPSAWQSALRRIEANLTQGERFSTCLAKQDGFLDPAFVGLIRVSEAAGEIALAFKTMRDQLSTQIELTRQIQQALAYPLITVGSALLLLIAMILWVIPVFGSVFENFNATLPWPTQLLLSASHQISSYAPVLGILFAIAAIGLSLLWKSHSGFQKACDRRIFQIPILGNLFRQSALACWCRNLGYLIEAGLPALEAMRITAQSANQWFSHDLSAHMFKSLAQGWSFGEAMERADPRQRFFDPETRQLLCIGNASGYLGSMLGKRADALSKELSSQLQLLSHSLEPILIGLVGLFIGGLVIILYLPIFNLGHIV
jgi:type IV pilus assembly protein PilC